MKWRDDLRIQVAREYIEECQRDEKLQQSLDETDRLLRETNELLRRAGQQPLPPSEARAALRRTLDEARAAREKRMEDYRRMFERTQPPPKPVQKG